MKKQWPLDTALSYDPYFGEPNRDGDQGYEILPDGKVLIHIKAPGAKEVVIDQFGTIFNFTKINDEIWEATVDLGKGFKYFFIKIDGNEVLNPYLPIGYGCCRPMNFLDIPVPGEEDWDTLEGIPHGGVTRQYFYSTVTEKLEICLVYTPANYDPNKKYPVLYLQHGYGENETGWVYQGHAARIADKLIYEGKMTECLIVMACGMTQFKEPKMVFHAFTDVILKDLIPYIEGKYNVLTDKWHRAMAGLSMGSYQTSMVTMSNPDLFGYVGVFSGFMSFPRPDGAKEPHLDLIEDKEKFNSSFKVFYRAMGTEDNYFKSFEHDDQMLEGKGLNIIRELFPGHHDWSVWRRCIHSFFPRIFKD
ncbi:MAG: enterochelin esterase [Lachnospiraceae bacterium]|nr:enterochelin esterase [Lachnospiraceae bacterium]MBR6476488.1 enterochelin esterase [Lachnospiraceae bacterium]